ncbi:MAG: class I SAM-dependent methyltransferase [Betaproteobacteria bacterium]|nr:class I SAM-dependent methyltransferase [Betaproteobacteria bacterium]
MSFDPAGYWQQRITGAIEIDQVGHRSLGARYNYWIYRRRLEALTEWAQRQFGSRPIESVLELGSGSGFYITFWQQHGAGKIVGVDISEDSRALLAGRYPAHRFVQGDIGAPALAIEDTFEVVTIFDVLYHIVDDGAARNALRNAAKAMTEAGTLLVFDQLLERDTQLTRHVKFRGRASFETMLAEAGLTIAEEIPLFVLLEPPLTSSRALNLAISGIYHLFGAVFRLLPPVGDGFGRMVHALDGKLLARGIRNANHAIYVIRKRPSA